MFDFEDNEMIGMLLELFGGLYEFGEIYFCYNKIIGGIGMFGNCSKMYKFYFFYNLFIGMFLLYLG